jgi:nitrate reductase gamma subunit
MLIAGVSTAYGSRRQLPLIGSRRARRRCAIVCAAAWRRVQGAKPGVAMNTVLFHFSTLAILSVFVVLLLGLWNMMRGTSPNTSQKLMRWRVGLQFVAILAIIAFFLLNR